MNRRKEIIRFASVFFMVLCMIICTVNLGAKNYKKIVDLNGSWKFSIGDNSEWVSPDFNDTKWEGIQVPSAWENQGFHGYDGFAWYRKSFSLSNLNKNVCLVFLLGNIDDVDEVFLNGKRIGQSGSFPPHYSTAFKANRAYHVPFGYLREKNTIAIRVYDDAGIGGIIRGDISLAIDQDAIPVDIDLQGVWKFKTGQYVHKDLKSVKEWDDIIVPGNWDDQGYKNYDGYACYVLDFDLNPEPVDERMVLVLGKIDDLDQVIVNGVLVGQSGEFEPSTVKKRRSIYKENRAYYLPANLLKSGEKNRIVVRVYDIAQAGGIYTGSIGLVSQERYREYWHNRRKW